MYIHIYVYIYVCIYTYICICIHTQNLIWIVHVKVSSNDSHTGPEHHFSMSGAFTHRVLSDLHKIKIQGSMTDTTPRGLRQVSLCQVVL